jgi:GNAT superfamily N-acetyltransferase
LTAACTAGIVPPMPSSLHVERSGADQLETWLGLYNRLVPRYAFTMEESGHFARVNPELVDLLARRGPQVVGVACCWPYREAADAPALNAVLVVDPAERRRGVGSALYAALSEIAAAAGKTRLDVDVSDLDPDGGAFAEHRGFREVIERNVMVALDLTRIEAPAIEPPPGIELVSYAARPDLARAVWEIAGEALPDIPSDGEPAVPGDLATFRLRHFEDATLPHDAFLIALAGDEAVGYATLRVRGSRPTVGMHFMTAVRRAWRGRGIAGALKRAHVAWAKQAGLTALETGNEERNAPIRALNARFGYRQIEVRTTLRGPLA